MLVNFIGQVIKIGFVVIILYQKSYIFLMKEIYVQDINNIKDWNEAKKFITLKRKLS